MKTIPLPGLVALNRLWLLVVLSALLGMLAAGEARAVESLVVTTTVDEDNGTSDPAVGTGTSLREAINRANSDGVDSVITFDPVVFAAPRKTITLTLGQFTLLPDGALSIFGLFQSGAGVKLDANHASRVFTVPRFASVTLPALTIVNGSSNTGGGVENGGTLVMVQCTLQNNSATQGARSIPRPSPEPLPGTVQRTWRTAPFRVTPRSRVAEFTMRSAIPFSIHAPSRPIARRAPGAAVSSLFRLTMSRPCRSFISATRSWLAMWASISVIPWGESSPTSIRRFTRMATIWWARAATPLSISPSPATTCHSMSSIPGCFPSRKMAGRRRRMRCDWAVGRSIRAIPISRRISVGCRGRLGRRMTKAPSSPTRCW